MDVTSHPAQGYYELNAYPVRTLKTLGATLIAGSDAPVNTRDPQPFVNMALAVTRADGGKAGEVAKTKVLETFFMGAKVYRRAE